MSGLSDTNKSKLLVGQLGKAHGLKGDLRLNVLAEGNQVFQTGQVLTSETGQAFVIKRYQEHKPQVMKVKFEAIENRTQAEALVGLKLFIERERLPQLDHDEFYHDDLYGLRVLDYTTGKIIGTIKTVQNFGAGDLLEIDREQNSSEFISFTAQDVPEVNIKEGYVKIIPPTELWR